MNRRRFVLLTGMGVTTALSGCAGDTDDDDDDDDVIDDGDDHDDSDDADDGNDVDMAALAQQAADLIDQELGLAPISDDDPGWEFGQDEEQWFVEYWTSGDPLHDFEICAGAYADIVAEGFEPDAVLMAVEETDDGLEQTAYDADIERSWAEEYNACDINMDELVERIDDTKL